MMIWMCARTRTVGEQVLAFFKAHAPGSTGSWAGSSAARTRKEPTTWTEPPVRNVPIGRGVFSKATNAGLANYHLAQLPMKGQQNHCVYAIRACSASAVYERKRSGHAENPTRCQRTSSRT